jgi:hypothetical protein
MATPASATTEGCNPQQYNPYRTDNFDTEYLAGMLSWDGFDTFGGVTAQVYNYNDFITQGNPDEWENNANQSILLDNQESESWAQVGELKWKGGNHEVYVQLTLNDVVQWTNFFGPADAWDTYSSFKVTYNPSGPGGVYFDWYWASPGYPYSLLTTSKHNFTPDDAQLEVETHDQATEFPGTFGNRSYDKGQQMYEPDSGGSWITYNGTVVYNGPTTFIGTNPAEGNSGKTLETWDAGCPS